MVLLSHLILTMALGHRYTFYSHLAGRETGVRRGYYHQTQMPYLRGPPYALDCLPWNFLGLLRTVEASRVIWARCSEPKSDRVGPTAWSLFLPFGLFSNPLACGGVDQMPSELQNCSLINESSQILVTCPGARRAAWWADNFLSLVCYQAARMVLPCWFWVTQIVYIDRSPAFGKNIFPKPLL